MEQDPPVLAAFVRAIGLRQGDVQKMSLAGPSGQTLAEKIDEPLRNDRAEQFVLVGRRRPPSGWPSGVYEATYQVERAGAIALQTRFSHRF
jgi:hypothetical protein